MLCPLTMKFGTQVLQQDIFDNQQLQVCKQQQTGLRQQTLVNNFSACNLMLCRLHEVRYTV